MGCDLTARPRACSDLGVHIDGYAAVAAHTAIVGGGAPTGRQADVMAAVATAADVIMRMLKPGTKVGRLVLAALADRSRVGCTGRTLRSRR